MKTGIKSDEIYSFVENGYAIFWLKDEMKFARIRDFKPEFYDRKSVKFDEILTARIFDSKKEIFINNYAKNPLITLLNEDGLKKGESNDNADYLKSEFRLLGRNPKPLGDGFYSLESESGSKFIIPLEASRDFEYIKISRIDYFGVYEKTNQAYYKNFRLCDIKGVWYE